MVLDHIWNEDQNQWKALQTHIQCGDGDWMKYKKWK